MMFGRRIHEPVVVATCPSEDEAEEMWTTLLDADIPAVIQHDPAMLGGPKSFQVLVEGGRSAEAIRVLSEASSGNPPSDT
jgi:hypothetical protein